MESVRTFERRRRVRGAPYSLEQFQQKYALQSGEAEDLYARFGPSSIELDLLMAAKRRKPCFSSLSADFELR
ncbi:hypothetical protein [Rhizobium grahamii]|uniref:Uncharacterized protein n=1 Tax=Rhizobium grahamii CCGE 502 TaxID=990285 RepID=S3IA79_9HYPH|nr:hypothetical protein [Rhizobium grahamii]EPE96168.1 hypothetical protein RGCCGE502_21345 [Rhizobium grahamii CCGE 502]